MYNKGDILINKEESFAVCFRIDSSHWSHPRHEFIYNCWLGYEDEGHLVFDYVTGITETFLRNYVNNIKEVNKW